MHLSIYSLTSSHAEEHGILDFEATIMDYVPLSMDEIKEIVLAFLR